MSRFSSFFLGGGPPEEVPMEDHEPLEPIIDEEEKARLEKDKSLLAQSQTRETKLRYEATREVVSAAEDSIRKLHVLQMGRCPECNSHLRRHLFAAVCETCGWHQYDTPRRTPVRIHLKDGDDPIEGDRCYEVRAGDMLVLRGEMVVARVPARSVGWVEYVWSEEEIDQRHKLVIERMDIQCGWCFGKADPDKDGFHLVHVAFGTAQERYCFCSDECYEAFRKMYPARVDRNCYERNCADCNLCLKRYGDEAEGVRLLAKDFLRVRNKPKDKEKDKSGAPD